MSTTATPGHQEHQGHQGHALKNHQHNRVWHRLKAQGFPKTLEALD